MKAVILAGGLGTRLRPFTDSIPKPLLPIGEKAVLEIQIERLKYFGFTEIYLATNYKSEYIERFFGDGKDFGVNIVVSKEEKPLGTAGPIKLLEKYFEEPFLVMNGDILSLCDFSKLYDFACKQNSKLTVSVKKHIMPYAFGNIFFDGDIVTGIQEKPDIITFALAGIYIMRPEVLCYIPDGKQYGIDALIIKMLNNGDPISKYEIEEYWLDIGRAEDYYKAQNDYELFMGDNG